MMMKKREGPSKSGTTASIHDGLKKATAEMLVLFALSQQKMYTYEIEDTIKRLSEGRLSYNTLYQTTHRLQDCGYISMVERALSDDNHVRVYYSITELGKVYLGDLRNEYQNFIDTIALFFSKIHSGEHTDIERRGRASVEDRLCSSLPSRWNGQDG